MKRALARQMPIFLPDESAIWTGLSSVDVSPWLAKMEVLAVLDQKQLAEMRTVRIEGKCIEPIQGPTDLDPR